jgi:hypothetical protein
MAGDLLTLKSRIKRRRAVVDILDGSAEVSRPGLQESDDMFKAAGVLL